MIRFAPARVGVRLTIALLTCGAITVGASLARAQAPGARPYSCTRAAGACRSRGTAQRPELDDGARAAAREGANGRHRCLLRRRLDHAPLGRDGLPGSAGALAPAILGWNAGNFGWGADRTQNILWRLENGELDGVHPKVIVIQGGTNNVGTQPGETDTVADITRGLAAILNVYRRKRQRRRSS